MYNIQKIKEERIQELEKIIENLNEEIVQKQSELSFKDLEINSVKNEIYLKTNINISNDMFKTRIDELNEILKEKADLLISKEKIIRNR